MMVGSLVRSLASPRSSSLAGAIAASAAFVAFNWIVAGQFNLLERLKSFWAVKKLHHVFLGIIIGVLPWGVALVAGEDLQFGAMGGLTVTGVFGTLMIILWEELWFRGMPLNLAGDRYGKMGATIVFAAAFVVLHLMNPEIKILPAAPGLFLAGYVLGAAYFVFSSLWAPVGIHFVHNVLTSVYPHTEGTPAHNLGLLLLALPLTAALAGLRLNQVHKINLLRKFLPGRCL